jgi:hypothetical protein
MGLQILDTKPLADNPEPAAPLERSIPDEAAYQAALADGDGGAIVRLDAEARGRMRRARRES